MYIIPNRKFNVGYCQIAWVLYKYSYQLLLLIINFVLVRTIRKQRTFQSTSTPRGRTQTVLNGSNISGIWGRSPDTEVGGRVYCVKWNEFIWVGVGAGESRDVIFYFIFFKYIDIVVDFKYGLLYNLMVPNLYDCRTGSVCRYCRQRWANYSRPCNGTQVTSYSLKLTGRVNARMTVNRYMMQNVQVRNNLVTWLWYAHPITAQSLIIVCILKRRPWRVFTRIELHRRWYCNIIIL